MMVDTKVFYTFDQYDNLISCVLMVDDTVDGKVGDIMMYHFS